MLTWILGRQSQGKLLNFARMETHAGTSSQICAHKYSHTHTHELEPVGPII